MTLTLAHVLLLLRGLAVLRRHARSWGVVAAVARLWLSIRLLSASGGILRRNILSRGPESASTAMSILMLTVAIVLLVCITAIVTRQIVLSGSLGLSRHLTSERLLVRGRSLRGGGQTKRIIGL